MTISNAKRSARTSSTSRSLKSLMIALEQQLVFDAALAAELQNLTEHSTADANHGSPSLSGDSLIAAAQTIDAHAVTAMVEASIEAYVAEHNLAPANHEIAFVDSRLAGLDVIVAAIPEGTRIVLIDGARDGVAQMVEALKGEQGISAIHLVSHGTAGQIDLGGSLINAETMSTIYRSALTSISANLSADADILIYGCDFGAGAAGAQATQLLADLTGADVTDSTDLTGAADKGGDWDLEQQTGSIEARGIAAQSYEEVLSVTQGTSESFDNPANPTAESNRDNFEAAFPAGTSPLSKFAGTPGYFYQTTEAASPILPAYSGTAYSGMHSGEQFAQESIQLALDVTIPAGVKVGLDFAAYQMNLSAVAGGFFNEPGTFSFYGILAGSTADATTITTTHAGFGTSPDVDLLGVSPIIDTTTQWTHYSLGFTAARSYDRILVTPNSAAANPTGAFLAIDAINFGFFTNDPPVTVDPPGPAHLDPLNPSSILVPATDNVALTFDLTSAFTDPNGDPLTITPNMTGAPAWLSYDAATHTFSGTPPVDNSGADVVIPVQVDDGQGGTLGVTVTFQIANPAPLAVADSSNTAFNTPVTVDFLANDSDPDSDPLTVTTATLADSATGTLTNAGSVWTFAPASGFTGTAAINYAITDQDGATSVSTHDVVVAPNPNTPPIDGDETLSTGQGITLGAPAATGLLANATDADGDTLSITGYTIAGIGGSQSVGAPVAISGVGSITINSDGGYDFAPAPGYSGPVPAITYTIDDGQGGIDTSTLSLSVTAAPNTAPVDGDDSNAAVQSQTLIVQAASGLLANATDADGNPLTITGYTIAGISGTQPIGSPIVIPGVGVISVNADGGYSFTPVTAFGGTVPTITYTVDDGQGGTDTSTLSLLVTPTPRAVGPDTDGDGVDNTADLDDDNDGVLDENEGVFVLGDPPIEDLVIVLDGSNSISFVDWDTIREQTAQAIEDISVIPHNGSVRLSVVQFSTGAQIEITPVVITAANFQSIADMIRGIDKLDSGTNTNLGLDLAVASLSGLNPASSQQTITLITDGAPDNQSSAAASAAAGIDTLNIIGIATNPTNDANNAALIFPLPDGDTNGFYVKANTYADYAAALRQTIGTSNPIFVDLDTDGDGIVDRLDIDSDNDGISDLVESGQNPAVVDTNNDGVVDGLANNVTGIPAATPGGVTPIDTDGDGIRDLRDLDSDNDGIADAIEALPTAGYVSITSTTDSDGDGVISKFDTNSVFGGTFTVPVDTDGDGMADYRDTNSDGDALLDSAESGLTPGVDANGDGIGDALVRPTRIPTGRSCRQPGSPTRRATRRRSPIVKSTCRRCSSCRRRRLPANRR